MISQENCSHQKNKSEWIPGYIDEDWGHEVSGRWEYTTEYTCEDVDLHRFRCTQCKKMFYYSSAARNYHENGVKTEIPGLGG